ncbi:MAG TPA: TMEM165/GDT1 family protein [Gemmatimonadales bacterium]|jgi:putative Ca2+/H+ antiporter (TMEM165/GDT1 family)
MLAIFIATYVAVFAAEIVGDKLLYTTGVLATRYRTTPIVIGVTIAFMLKMGAAVALGQAIAHLPRWIVALVTAASFCGVAWTVWRKPVTRTDSPEEKKSTPTAALVAFAAVFFSEWGDVGQITAATMAARFASPVAVWLGAVSAMLSKGALAASVGAGVRRWIQNHLSPKVIRIAGVALLLVLGVLSVLEALFETHG